MGLLDSLKSTFTSTGEASVPPAASFATREGVIYAPVNGVLVNPVSYTHLRAHET